jgi:hypothetical protein
MNRSLTALLLAAAVGACEPARPEVRAVATTLDSSGAYPVVRISGDAPTWHAERVAVVGAAPDGGSEFGSVRSVLLDTRGFTYVLDPSSVQLSVYDETGAFRRHLGRRGGGPGEYRMPYSVARLGDSIALFDPGLSRISLLGPDGTWLREWPTPPNTGPQVVRLYRTAPVSFWAFATKVGPAGLERVFVRYESSGPTDTLPFPKSSVGAGSVINCNSPDGSFSFYPQPFGPAPIAVPTPAGERAVAVSSAYRISFLGRDDDTLRALERDVSPPRISDADWAGATQEWQEFRKMLPDAHCNRDGFARPAVRPLLGLIFFDDRQQMWVEMFTATGQQYDVYDQTGALIGTVEGLPATSGIEPSVVAGRIALVVPDSLGEQVVHVFQIRTVER